MKPIGVNGYGIMGKRAADAVPTQDDMQIVGVTKRTPDFKAQMAIEKGYDLYISASEREGLFKDAGIEISRTIDELYDQLDIIIDCTPGGIGAKNKPNIYEEKGLQAIFEGGEKHEKIGKSFTNYGDSLGADYVQVFSCNTTYPCRTLKPIDDLAGVTKVQAVMVRRGSDPRRIKSGPINAVHNPPIVLSSHRSSVQTVMYGLDISTMALLVPATFMHKHNLMVEFIYYLNILNQIFAHPNFFEICLGLTYLFLGIYEFNSKTSKKILLAILLIIMGVFYLTKGLTGL